MSSFFISGFLLSLSLCLDIGTVNIAMIRTGIRRGFVSSFTLGVGSSFGDIFYAFLSFVCISLILKYELVRMTLWIGGTLVLLYLSYKMIRETLSDKKVEFYGNDTSERSTSSKDFITGFGLALSSPSAILWFATVGGSVIASKGDLSFLNISIFFTGFFVASIGWSALLGFISGQGNRYLGSKILKSVSLVSALLFIYFALKVFANGFREFL